MEKEDNTNEYKEVRDFIKVYNKHDLTGLAAVNGILEYASYIDKISYAQNKQLLYEFVNRMFLPEEYED